MLHPLEKWNKKIETLDGFDSKNNVIKYVFDSIFYFGGGGRYDFGWWRLSISGVHGTT